MIEVSLGEVGDFRSSLFKMEDLGRSTEFVEREEGFFGKRGG